MVKCLIWLFWTYLTLKLIQWVFGSRPRAWEPAPSFRQKLLRGEPILFAIAFALSVPTALASGWYLHRGYTRALEQSADCYGRLRAIDRLPEVRSRFDAYQVFQVVQGAEQGAAIAGQWLGLEPARVTRMLAQKMRFYGGRYAVLARRDDDPAEADEAAAIARCLREPPLNL